jgi:hypothetical protein
MDMRRKKLSDLLKYEEEQYRQEIIAIQETPLLQKKYNKNKREAKNHLAHSKNKRSKMKD